MAPWSRSGHPERESGLLRFRFSGKRWQFLLGLWHFPYGFLVNSIPRGSKIRLRMKTNSFILGWE